MILEAISSKIHQSNTFDEISSLWAKLERFFLLMNSTAK